MILNNRHRFTPFESPSWSLVTKPESEKNRKTREYYSATVDTSKLEKQKNPRMDLKLQYKKIYELTFVFSLTLIITTFQIFKQLPFTPFVKSKVDIKIEVADIPITKQIHRPPPPARPIIPIPTEDESIPEDVTIASTEINLSDIPPPPPPPEEGEESPIFFGYDEPPKIIGGLAEIQKNLKYPKIPRQAGIEGLVFVKVTVGVKGEMEALEVIRANPAHLGFEESALQAIQKVKWIPAKQRDKNIRVSVSIPVEFKLMGS